MSELNFLQSDAAKNWRIQQSLDSFLHWQKRIVALIAAAVETIRLNEVNLKVEPAA